MADDFDLPDPLFVNGEADTFDLPDPLDVNGPSWSDYAWDTAAAAGTGILSGATGLVKRGLYGLAGATDWLDSETNATPFRAPKDSLDSVRDFLLEQALTAKYTQEELNNRGVDRNKYGALSVPSLVQGGLGGAIEYSPALLNPVAGGLAIAGTGAADKYYDLPTQFDERPVAASEMPTELERLGSGVVKGGLEGLGAAIPAPWLTKPLRGVGDFLGRTAKTAGVGVATNVPVTLSDMASNEAFAGRDFTPEQYLQAAGESAATAAATAPFYAGLGSLAARGRPQLDTQTVVDAELARVIEGENGGLPAPEGVTYGPDAGFAMRDTPSNTDLGPDYLRIRQLLQNEKTTSPDPVQLNVKPRGVEEDGVLNVKVRPEKQPLIQVETTSARSPEQVAEAMAIRDELQPGRLWERQIEEGRATEVYGEAPPPGAEVVKPTSRRLSPEEAEVVRMITGKEPDERYSIIPGLGRIAPDVSYPVVRPGLETMVPTTETRVAPGAFRAPNQIQPVDPALLVEPPVKATLPDATLIDPEANRRAWIDEQRKVNPNFAPDIESRLELLTPEQRREYARLDDLRYRSVALTKDYKPYKLSKAEQDELRTLQAKYANIDFNPGDTFSGLAERPAEPTIKVETVAAPRDALTEDVQGEVKVRPAPKAQQLSLTGIEPPPNAKATRSSERGAVQFPKALEDAALSLRDKTSEFFESFKTQKGEGALPEIEQFLKGDGLRVLPASMQAGLRKGLIFPRTLAEKEADFNPVYRKVSAVQQLESRLAQMGHQQLKSYYQLPKESRAKLDQTLVALRRAAAELKKQGKVMPELSDESLARMGFDAEQISAYRDVRAFTDWSLDLVGNTLKRYAEKLAPEDQIVAMQDLGEWLADKRSSFYVPFVRPRGGWSVVGEDVQGNTSYYSVHKSKAEASRVAASRPGTKVEQLSNVVPDEIRGLPLDVQIAIGKTLEGEPQDVSLRGFRARLAKARLVEGFSEDLAPGFADYTSSLAKWSALTHGAPEVFGAISAIPSSKTGLKNYAQRYWADYKKGANPVASTILRAMNVYNLAGVPASGTVNLTQTFTTTLPLLSSSKWGGSAKDAPVILIKAAKDAAEHFALGAEKYAAKSAGNAERAAALKLGIETGDLDAQAMGDLANIRSGGNAKPGLYDALMKTFTVTEVANRRVAFLAGFDLARRQGLPFDAAVASGKEFVLATQFDMSDANRPQAFRGGVGRVLSQYKPFAGHMLRFYRNAFKQGEYKTAGISLASMMMFAGVRGLPFAGATIGLIDAMFGISTNEELRKMVKDKKYADTIIYGVPAGVLDINMSAAAGLGDQIPDIDQGIPKALTNMLLGPIGQLPFKAAKAYEAYEKDAPWSAAANIVPRFARGPVRAAEFQITGQISDLQGDPLIRKTGDPLQDAYTTGTLGYGFPSTDYTTEYEKRNLEAKKIERARDNDDINLRYAKALRAKDREKMKEIMQESRDSMKGDPADRKPIDFDRAFEYLLPRDVRTLRRSPKEIRRAIKDAQGLFTGSGE